MNAPWQGRKEGGGRFAIWLIRSIGLYCGRSVARSILYPITLYFFFRRGPERRASRAFLTRVLGHPPTPLQIMRHIHCFASTILDRVFLLARGVDYFRIEIEGLEDVHTTVDEGRGMLLLGSHLGSFEALRALSLKRPDLNLRVVLDKQQTPALTELLEALAPDIGRAVIDASQGGTAVVLAISEAVRQGHIVALLADRGRAGEATRPAPFLGAPAAFPVAPWLIASILEVPVVLAFGLYEGGNRYRLVFEKVTDKVVIPRRNRESALDSLIRGYAARLEHHARLVPYNWFNFYDFWQLPAPRGRRAAHPGTDADAAVHEGVRI